MRTNRRPTFLAVLGMAVATSASLFATAAHSVDSADPRTAPVPQLALDQDAQQKAMVANLAFLTGSAELQSATVVAGRGPQLIGNPRQLHVAVMSREAGALLQFDEADPLSSGVHEPNGQHHHDTAPSAQASFIFPFDPRASDLVVTRADTGAPVAQGSLAPAVHDYCQQHPSDHDCAADLSVSLSDSPDPAAAGGQVEYTARVTNAGPEPAQAVRLVDTIPEGTTFVSASDGCTSSGATVTCDLGYLASGATAQVSVRAAVAADLVFRNGGPATVADRAAVSNLAGSDPNPGNDTATESTQVVALSDLAVVTVQPASAPTQVVIGQPVPVTVAVTTTNHGPSAPTDATVTRTATADAGSSITPATGTDVEAAVGLEEARLLRSPYTVACTEPGSHRFTVTASIRPTHAADVDPNPANDSASASFSVDCVVPVAVNIKPGGSPNSVNPGDRGVIPLAVLSTKAGEYGLPLAFDATAIDVQTVRFSPRASSFAGLGATEVHGKVHPEDSYELDDRTRDGDLDAVMHFATQDSGIRPGTTEACVHGRYLAANGQRYTFFGCDSVSTVPS